MLIYGSSSHGEYVYTEQEICELQQLAYNQFRKGTSNQVGNCLYVSSHVHDVYESGTGFSASASLSTSHWRVGES